MDFILGREWQYAVIIASFLTLIAGFITSRKLPPKKKISWVRKFAYGAGLAIALLLLFEKPHVSFNAKTSYFFREQKAENLNSVEDIAKYEKDQALNVQLLREEVENLRKELYEVNNYYDGVVHSIMTATITFCLIGLFKRDEVNSEEEPTEKSKIL